MAHDPLLEETANRKPKLLRRFAKKKQKKTKQELCHKEKTTETSQISNPTFLKQAY